MLLKLKIRKYQNIDIKKNIFQKQSVRMEQKQIANTRFMTIFHYLKTDLSMEVFSIQYEIFFFSKKIT